MKSLKSKKVAVITTLVLILASVFIVGGNNLITMQASVKDAFENGTEASPISIQSQINAIVGQANNMLFVSRRYVNDEDEIILPLIIAIESLNMATTPEQKHIYTNNLIQEMQNLNSEKHLLNMSESDEEYFQSIIVNTESSMRIINNNDYNTIASDFNKKLTLFPANVISTVRGISPSYLYQ